MNITDLIRQHVGPNEIQQIASQIGIDPATATSAVDAAIPAISASAAEHAGGASAGGGASAVEGLLGSQAGGLLGGLGSLMNAGGGDSGGMLSGLLGQHADAIAGTVQKASGLDAGKAKQLVMLLAPMVLAAISRHSAGGAGGAGGAGQAAPSAGGMLGSLLNRAQDSQ